MSAKFVLGSHTSSCHWQLYIYLTYLPDSCYLKRVAWELYLTYLPDNCYLKRVTWELYLTCLPDRCYFSKWPCLPGDSSWHKYVRYTSIFDVFFWCFCLRDFFDVNIWNEIYLHIFIYLCSTWLYYLGSLPGYITWGVYLVILHGELTWFTW